MSNPAALKLIGTKITFNGYKIGKVQNIGQGDLTKEFAAILHSDSEDGITEYISTHKTLGQIPFEFVFTGQTDGPFEKLLADFYADTVATLEIEYRNGTKKSIDAELASLPTAGGAVSGGHAVTTATFQMSGKLTYTPVAAQG